MKPEYKYLFKYGEKTQKSIEDVQNEFNATKREVLLNAVDYYSKYIRGESFSEESNFKSINKKLEMLMEKVDRLSERISDLEKER